MRFGCNAWFEFGFKNILFRAQYVWGCSFLSVNCLEIMNDTTAQGRRNLSPPSPSPYFLADQLFPKPPDNAHHITTCPHPRIFWPSVDSAVQTTDVVFLLHNVHIGHTCKSRMWYSFLMENRFSTWLKPFQVFFFHNTALPTSIYCYTLKLNIILRKILN